MEKEENPWVTTADEYGDPTGCLAGNEAGFKLLKEKIDEALVHGEASCEGMDIDFIEIKKYRNKKEIPPETLKVKAIKFGCLSIIVISAMIFFFGVYKLYETIK